MTRDEILALKPGREMDALVAEHIFGYRRVKTPPDINGENGGDDVLVPPSLSKDYVWPPKGKIALWFFCKDWSTEIAGAWEVVEHLTDKKHWTFKLKRLAGKDYKAYFKRVSKGGNIDAEYPSPPTKEAPEAICKAALLATLEAI